MFHYFLRLGCLAEIRSAFSAVALDRRRRVIVRTARGVELGEIVGPCRRPGDDNAVRILRPTTDEDELLIRRLQRHKREAVEACRAALAEEGSTAALLDIDQLFDGGTLIMHFLGPVDSVAEAITRKVADRYESIVRSRHFAKLLIDGCGPDCGTKDGGGCGGGCAGCAVSAACAGSG